LRRPADFRAIGRLAALLRRALPERFFADFFAIGLRADLLADFVDFLFAIFAMVLSRSLSISAQCCSARSESIILEAARL